MCVSGGVFIALMRAIMRRRWRAPFAASEPKQDGVRYLTWLSSSLPIVCNCMLEVPS